MDKKLKCFFLDCINSQRQKQRHDDDDDDDDEHDDDDDDNRSSRTQIPPLGYGETPTTPFGKTISTRMEWKILVFGSILTNTIQEYLG